jgi:hypothetical protein
MTDAEFGNWMMENLELMLPIEEEMRAAGRLLPETSDSNILHNALVLVEEFDRRHRGRRQNSNGGAN